MRGGDKDKRLIIAATVLAAVALGLTLCAPDLARWVHTSGP